MSDVRKYKHFSYADRQRLEKLWNGGASVHDIAEEIERTRAAVYAELKRGYDGSETEELRDAYNAELAQRAYVDGCRRKGWRKSAVSG